MDDWQFYEMIQEGFNTLAGILIEIRDKLPAPPTMGGACAMCGTQWYGRELCPHCFPTSGEKQ
jgi:hypothetical protein